MHRGSGEQRLLMPTVCLAGGLRKALCPQLIVLPFGNRNRVWIAEILDSQSIRLTAAPGPNRHKDTQTKREESDLGGNISRVRRR